MSSSPETRTSPLSGTYVGSLDWQTYFSSPGKYPHIDVAWKAALALLADGCWHSQAEMMIELMAAAVPGLAIGTAHNVLTTARTHGVVQFEYRRAESGKRWRIFYKVSAWQTEGLAA